MPLYRIYDTKKVLREMAECDGIVYDLDNTLVRGRIAQGVGKKFLLSELVRGHLHHVWLGASNYKEVLRRGNENEAEGLGYFIEIAGRTGCMTSGKFGDYCHSYRELRYLCYMGTQFAI